MQVPTKLTPADYAVTVYFHSPEFGVSLKDIQKPEYWVHVARQLRPGHRIEVLASDETYWAMLIVRAVGRTEAVVQVLQEVKLGKSEAPADAESPFEIKWRGPTKKFSAVRKSDGAVVKEDMQTREQADQWLKNHLKTMAA